MLASNPNPCIINFLHEIGKRTVKQACEALATLGPHLHSVASKLQPLEAVTNSSLAAVEERKGGDGGAPLAKATCKDFFMGPAHQVLAAQRQAGRLQPSRKWQHHCLYHHVVSWVLF